MKQVAMQTSHTFTETARMVYCVTEIVVTIIIIIICCCDIKIINTQVQITINLSSITSNAMLEKDGEDQLDQLCEERRSITQSPGGQECRT